mmetsp:Transcript_13009/g.20178  ORF Transcript_13009/g.20178 Transcript_13009/m.20178 type:complete len:102 (-) Transcript_13009:59-364(-)
MQEGWADDRHLEYDILRSNTEGKQELKVFFWNWLEGHPEKRAIIESLALSSADHLSNFTTLKIKLDVGDTQELKSEVTIAADGALIRKISIPKAAFTEEPE